MNDIHEHFLASYYRRLIDAEFERGQLNRLTIFLALPGLLLSAAGHWLDLEWLRCLGAIPLLIAAVTGSNSLLHSIRIRRLRHELEAPGRARPPGAPSPSAASPKDFPRDPFIARAHACHWRLAILLALSLTLTACDSGYYLRAVRLKFPHADITRLPNGGCDYIVREKDGSIYFATEYGNGIRVTEIFPAARAN